MFPYPRTLGPLRTLLRVMLTLLPVLIEKPLSHVLLKSEMTTPPGGVSPHHNLKQSTGEPSRPLDVL